MHKEKLTVDQIKIDGNRVSFCMERTRNVSTNDSSAIYYEHFDILSSIDLLIASPPDILRHTMDHHIQLQQHVLELVVLRHNHPSFFL